MRPIALRIGWLFRAFAPHVVGWGLAALVYWSYGPADLPPWTEVDLAALGRFDTVAWGTVGGGLATFNVVTKAALVVLGLLVGWYLADLNTSGRKAGWCLVAPYSSTSRVGQLKAWTLLALVLAIAVGTTTTAALDGWCGWPSAVRWLALVDGLLLAVMLVVNRNFEAFQLRFPSIQRARLDRGERTRELRERRLQEREANEDRRRQLLEMRRQFESVSDQLRATEAEIRELDGAGYDTRQIEGHSVDLAVRRQELLRQLQELEESYPDRV